MDLSGVDIIVNAVVGKSLRQQVGCNTDIFNRVKERVHNEVSDLIAKGHEEFDIILLQKKRLQAMFCGEKLLYEATHKKEYQDDLADDSSEELTITKEVKKDKSCFDKQKNYGKENESRKSSVKDKDTKMHKVKDWDTNLTHKNGEEDERPPERGKEKNHRRRSCSVESGDECDKPYKFGWEKTFFGKESEKSDKSLDNRGNSTIFDEKQTNPTKGKCPNSGKEKKESSKNVVELEKKCIGKESEKSDKSLDRVNSTVFDEKQTKPTKGKCPNSIKEKKESSKIVVELEKKLLGKESEKSDKSLDRGNSTVLDEKQTKPSKGKCPNSGKEKKESSKLVLELSGTKKDDAKFKKDEEKVFSTCDNAMDMKVKNDQKGKIISKERDPKILMKIGERKVEMGIKEKSSVFSESIKVTDTDMQVKNDGEKKQNCDDVLSATQQQSKSYFEYLMEYKNDPDVLERVQGIEIRGKEFPISNDGSCPRCNCETNVFVVLDFLFPSGDMPEILHYLLTKGKAVLWSSKNIQFYKDPPNFLCQGKCPSDIAKCGYNLNWREIDLSEIFLYPKENNLKSQDNMKINNTIKDNHSKDSHIPLVKTTAMQELDEYESEEEYDEGDVDIDYYTKDISWVVLDEFQYFGKTPDTYHKIDKEAVIRNMLAFEVAREDFIKGKMKKKSNIMMPQCSATAGKEKHQKEKCTPSLHNPPSGVMGTKQGEIKLTKAQASKILSTKDVPKCTSAKASYVSSISSFSTSPSISVPSTSKVTLSSLKYESKSTVTSSQTKPMSSLPSASSDKKCVNTPAHVQKNATYYASKPSLASKPSKPAFTAQDFPISKDGVCPYCHSSDVVYIILQEEDDTEPLPALLERLFNEGMAVKRKKVEYDLPSFQCKGCTYGFNLDWKCTNLEKIFNISAKPNNTSYHTSAASNSNMQNSNYNQYMYNNTNDNYSYSPYTDPAAAVMMGFIQPQAYALQAAMLASALSTPYVATPFGLQANFSIPPPGFGAMQSYNQAYSSYASGVQCPVVPSSTQAVSMATSSQATSAKSETNPVSSASVATTITTTSPIETNNSTKVTETKILNEQNLSNSSKESSDPKSDELYDPFKDDGPPGEEEEAPEESDLYDPFSRENDEQCEDTVESNLSAGSNLSEDLKDEKQSSKMDNLEEVERTTSKENMTEKRILLDSPNSPNSNLPACVGLDSSKDDRSISKLASSKEENNLKEITRGGNLVSKEDSEKDIEKMEISVEIVGYINEDDNNSAKSVKSEKSHQSEPALGSKPTKIASSKGQSKEKTSKGKEIIHEIVNDIVPEVEPAMSKAEGLASSDKPSKIASSKVQSKEKNSKGKEITHANDIVPEVEQSMSKAESLPSSDKPSKIASSKGQSKEKTSKGIKITHELVNDIVPEVAQAMSKADGLASSVKPTKITSSKGQSKGKISKGKKVTPEIVNDIVPEVAQAMSKAEGLVSSDVHKLGNGKSIVEKQVKDNSESDIDPSNKIDSNDIEDCLDKGKDKGKKEVVKDDDNEEEKDVELTPPKKGVKRKVARGRVKGKRKK